MSEELRVHTKPGKPTGKEITCPDCGHKWYSRGKGNYYRCPACYERETGKQIGSHFKQTKGLTLRIKPENPGQANDPDPVPAAGASDVTTPGGAAGKSDVTSGAGDQQSTGFWKKPLFKL